MFPSFDPKPVGCLEHSWATEGTWAEDIRLDQQFCRLKVSHQRPHVVCEGPSLNAMSVYVWGFIANYRREKENADI